MSQLKFVSNWESLESVPEAFVCPPEKRFGISVKKMIPVIDFATDDRAFLVKKILDVTREFGFFQMKNHGVSKRLIEETMKITKEFHAMSPEDKERECSKDPNKSCGLYTSSHNYEKEEFHHWKNTLELFCHPLDRNVQFWPENPPKFREVVKEYLVVMKKLAIEILDLLGEGLGLEKGYFGGKISENPVFFIHNYPPCPNPSLTKGLSSHGDPSLITILFQDVNGLQFFNDGQWIDVDPLDDVLLINFGYLFEIISNGKRKAIEHRVATNTTTTRQSLVYLVYPENDVTVEPAKCLINETNRAHYQSFNFKDFMTKYMSMHPDRETVAKYITLNQPQQFSN